MELKDLLEGFEGAEKVIEFINNKAAELKAKVLIDDGKENIYIPKNRLDDEIAKKKQLKEQLDLTNQELTNLKKDLQDKPELLKKIQELENSRAEFEKKLQNLSLESAIKLAAINAKAKDKTGSDVLAFINKEKLQLKEDGSIEGLEDELKALKQAKPYLFDEEPGGTGDPGNPAKGKSNINPKAGSIGENLAKMTYGNLDQIAEVRDSFFK